MFVKDAMTRPVETVTPDTSLLFVARRMKDNEIGCVPVAEEGSLVGVITDRDIACRGVATSDSLGDFKARDVMTRTVFSCQESANLSDAVRIMMDREVFHLPVVDRRKSLVGMLALSDIALKAPSQMSTILRTLAGRDAARKAPEKSRRKAAGTKAKKRR